MRKLTEFTEQIHATAQAICCACISSAEARCMLGRLSCCLACLFALASNSISQSRQMSLDGYLLVDPPSMAAMHILQEERHPSKMGIGQSKEGFSLLAMLNSCVGVPGRRLMRLWFLRPIIDLQVQSLQQFVSAMQCSLRGRCRR